MRTCTHCKKTKEDASFATRGRRRQSWCLDCHATYNREYYLANREVRKAILIKQSKARTKERKKFLDALKSKPCKDCGKSFHPIAMDFDHVRGKKVTNIATFLRRGLSLTDLETELAKCEVVCACCLRLRTLKRRTPP